ncbi:disulfide bond formation protein B, partial [Comamonas thiooxydans]|uniref:disulfide bond formation protein B n=1 Tax=Comamonas thiooxydans TaxID=363952 RepID=UPI0011847E29
MHSNLSRLTHPLTIASACGGLLLFGLYLQHAQGLTPCPMCIVQRYCLVLVGVAALLIHATRNAARAAFT